MSPAVKTTVTDLPESRVRVEAEIPPDEIERRMQQTARQLGKDLRMPGFRKGKVPPPVVIQRIGREAVLDEAVRSTLGRWYVDAVEASGIHPVGDPDVDLGDLPDEGKPLTFSFEIGVRPTAQLGDYKGVEAPKRKPVADDAAVGAEIEALRERSARLEKAERAAETGDFVVMDYLGRIDGEPFEGGEGRDQLIELGSGRLIPGFEEGLVGTRAGDEKTLDVTFPDDYPAEHLAGKPAQFDITVKEIQAKILPELDDDFATDAAGFDSMDDLRADIVSRMEQAEEQRIDGEFREAVLDAVAAGATIDVPEPLVEARAKELWERMLHSLSHQGINKEAYLRISGRDEEEILAEAKPDAENALRREAVIAAVVEAEGIEASDGDVLDALQESAQREGTTPEKLRARLEKSGRLDELRADLAQRQAIDLMVEHATAVDAPEPPPADEPVDDDADPSA
ncbi:MAG: trigger factor [Verrucomicrobiota bacterium]